ncbi:unnamed protein product [Polarella glacialis]|uniref:Uncharacterized protein n=1 Tax=Polarella glacialis TaxID=89957 RepID=A0A813L882_POLGL|nr:unnamed protein product [Polarella glacialis]
MTQDSVGTDVGAAANPLGGVTQGVWVTDSTPPALILVSSEAINHETIQLTLQLNEPGTIWCAATSLNSASSITFCKQNEIQAATSASGTCYHETFIKGSAAHGTVFRSDVNEAYRDVKIEVNRILQKDEAGSAPLEHETGYNIFCFAEDDWLIEAQAASYNSVSFVAPSSPMKTTLASVQSFQGAIGLQTTLDDTPPSFTKLEIQDPSASNNAIVVTFALNEPGTAYCRATRSDSGETAADMPISRILTANWEGDFNMSLTEATIMISNLENVNPLLTVRDDETALIAEATQYDVYCVAKDTAESSLGFPRVNFMIQDYVGTAVGSVATPAGGKTEGVWVTDSTPPTLILVSSESINHETIQLTLQLNEPGTIWCAATSLNSASSTSFCKQNEIQDATSASGTCYHETFIKGSAAHSTVFRSDVNEAYRDVKIEVNRILQKDEAGSAPLEHETGYNIFCFAEDDWLIEAQAASYNSVSFVAPSSPMKTTLASVQSFQGAIGLQTTLDDTPPSFTKLEIQDPSASNNAIVVTFALNEPGTAYCRATRSDSGETAADMPISRILTANWFAAYASTDVTIRVTKLENVQPSLTNRADWDVAIEEATQYNVYCTAVDDATDSFSLSRANYMTQDYVGTAVGVPTSPLGGTTAGVWVVDSTAPTMIFVTAESVGQETLQVTLQLNEPGTVWCQVAEPSTGTGTTYCREDQIQDAASGSACYWESFAKGSVAQGTTFRSDVHAAYTDVDVEVNKSWQKDMAAGAALSHQEGYKIFCFAEDDWAIQAAAATNSPNFYPPSSPTGTNLASQGASFKDQIDLQTTLDEAPPSFTKLQMQDPTASNSAIAVTFALNEAGTAYCRPVRADSGEAASGPLAINRILSAGWSAPHDPASATSAILMISGVQATPLEALAEAQRYDVYCWAKDDAVDSFGHARPQYMSQDYVGAGVVDGTTPVGGKTPGVWVADSIPPTMIFVAWDAVKTEDTLQLTLQLNEPGTVWCQAAEPSSAGAVSSCREDELQDSNPAADCYLEAYLKGGGGASVTNFRAEVHEAFVNVEVEVNRMPFRDGISSTTLPLLPKTGYKMFCFAEDDWKIQAQAAYDAGLGSPNFAAPALPNKVGLAAAGIFRDAVGTATTLDLTPPNFTVQGTTTAEDRILVQISLGEPGTAWCRALRRGSAVPEAQEVLETDFRAAVASVAGGIATVNVTAQDVSGEPLQRGTDYEVYCYARDLLCLGCSVPSGSTAQELLASKTLVRTADATAPRLRVLTAESIAHDKIQITLQVDEGSRLYCAAWTSAPASMSSNYEALIKAAKSTCHDSLGRECGSFWVYDLDDFEDTSGDGVTTISEYVAAGTWRFDEDVQIVLSGLVEQTAYSHIYCYAEDDETDGVGSSPNKMPFEGVDDFRVAIASVTTLDESPPAFTQLSIADPTAAEGTIAVTFALNEPGTAYCRATRVDSGETAGDMHINRILSAKWSVTYSGNDAA